MVSLSDQSNQVSVGSYGTSVRYLFFEGTVLVLVMQIVRQKEREKEGFVPLEVRILNPIYNKPPQSPQTATNGYNLSSVI